MAKITPGAIISEISGSIANVTYSRSKYGMYSKAKLNQTNPNTPAQIAARAIQAAAVAAWQALPQDEQSAWNTFAVSQLSKSRLSLRSTLNGYNAFIRFYIVRNSYGLTGNPDRVLEQPLGIYSGFSFTVNTSTLTLALDGNNVNTEIFAVARLSGPRSPGQSTITDSYVVIMDYQQAPNGTLVFDLKAAWEAKWGSLVSNGGAKIFAQIDIVNRVTAQKVAVFRGSGVITSVIPLVVVCQSGFVNNALTSPDGINWTQQTTPATGVWFNVTYAPDIGLFVAVGVGTTGNDVMTSPDGINWTLRSNPSTNSWSGIAWSASLTLLVAVSYDATGTDVMTSPDGINWTLRSNPSGHSWVAIVWSPTLSLFIAIAFDTLGNDIMTSPDGINWTLRSNPSGHSWYVGAWSVSLGLFVVIAIDGTSNDVMTSPDGINWTLRSNPSGHTWYSLTYSPSLSLFVAVAQDGTGNDVMTSPDGINWTLRSNPSGHTWNSVTWSASLALFVAVALDNTGNDVMTSPDGINWTLRSNPSGSNMFAITASS